MIVDPRRCFNFPREVLKWHVLQDGKRQWVSYRVNEETRRVSMEEWFERRRVGTYKLQLGGGSATCSFVVSALLRSQCGARLFWSLKCVWNAVGADSNMRQAYKTWRQNRWPAWVNFLHEDVGLPTQHLALAAPRRESRDAQHVGSEADLAFASASTHAAFALLCRWSSSSPQIGQWAACSRQCASLLRDFASAIAHMHLVVFAEARPQWSGPWYHAARRASATLELTKGMCCIAPLCDLADRSDELGGPLRNSLGRFGSDLAVVHIVDVMVACYDEEALTWAFRQIVWQLASRFEVEATGCLSSIAWWEQPQGLHFELDADSVPAHVRESILAAYLKNNARILHKPMHLTVCCDASRVGRKGVTLFAAVLPSNEAVWLAPQAGWVAKRKNSLQTNVIYQIRTVRFLDTRVRCGDLLNRLCALNKFGFSFMKLR